MKAKQIHEIDPWKVKIFIHRERDAERFERIRENIRKRGQLHPGEVRDIRHLPKEERQRERLGGHYDYGLITGQGRLLIARALKRPFLATIEDLKEIEVVGHFLAENLNREALPWAHKARLVQPELAAGKSHAEIAKRLDLSVNHVRKFERVLNKVAPEIRGAVERMPMNDAEVLTALPKDQQVIVMDIMSETKDRDVKAIVRKARAVAEEQGGQLSKLALSKSIQRVDEDLNDIRERMKWVRLHHAIGCQNLSLLLADSKFRAAMKREQVNFAAFEKLTEASK